ncbi:hypothetical protein [Legionella worsleiensis]|uniref:Transmembrane protein n=1 Tax=Legionella worsleiensis TaxID=45076 RepID=A0A0W1A390_9GAMM|nr:hypothetical protein [Legionella worsleiensis]KTD75786.1 transmembrane protein [Legionella worsleiensis]STY32804.1 transmembrane protein [Legionella worsleiensis]
MHLTQHTLKIPKIFSPHVFVEWGIKLAFLLILLLVIVPFSPKMPAPGLDASWALGLNQAVAQGLSFGKEIIFTLGPYSAIYTKFYHPLTDLMMIGGSIYLALSFWLCIVLLMQGVKWRWCFAFAVLIFGMIYARDSLFFAYPLIMSLVCFKNMDPHTNSSYSIQNKYLLLGILFAPLGLLSLIKGSLLLLSSAVCLLCSLFFALHKQKKMAFICFISPLASLVVFWIIAGQSIIHIPAYIYNSMVLATGFTEAMAVDGDNKEIVLYLLSSGLIGLAIIKQKHTTHLMRFFYFSIFFLFLFLSFKAGFTRHFGHSFITGTSILIAALLLPFLFHSKWVVVALITSLYTTCYIDGQHTKISLLNNFISTYTASWYGLKNRIQDPNWVKENYRVTMSYLRNQSSLPELKGTADIYSYDQSYLFASDAIWSPRPIFQSYSVFTPALAEKNKQHISIQHGPDVIVFRLQPIDDRFPSLEDGVSWLEFLNNYHPVQLVDHFLLLKKNEHPLIDNTPETITTERHYLGEIIQLPQSKHPVFTKLIIKPTLWGKIATILFKPAPLEISVVLHNGNKRQFRMIANMAQSGFLISPLIEETAEFGLLFSNNPFLENKKVKSITLTTSKKNAKHWQSEFTISFKNITNQTHHQI